MEFENKKIARAVARTLNNTRVSRKKHTFYYDDLWNIKYLSKFKWSYLTEKLGTFHDAVRFAIVARALLTSAALPRRAAYEKRVQQKRLETELSQTKRENSYYMKRVDEAHAIARMEQRRSQRIENATDETVRAREREKARKAKRVRRGFFQRSAESSSTKKTHGSFDSIL